MTALTPAGIFPAAERPESDEELEPLPEEPEELPDEPEFEPELLEPDWEPLSRRSTTLGDELEVIAELTLLRVLRTTETFQAMSATRTTETMALTALLHVQDFIHMSTMPTGQKKSRNSTMTQVFAYHGFPAACWYDPL